MISFIIPTKNEEKAIESTLKSISEYRGAHEIIVSDGNSTDRTIEIARRFNAKVLVYQGKVKQKISQGRNEGAHAAHGDILVFLDADVTIPNINTFFEKAERIFHDRPKVVALAVAIKVYPEMATTMDNIVFTFINHMHRILNNYFHMGAAPGEFQMIRTDAFKKSGGYNEELVASEDQELFRRLAEMSGSYFDGDLCVYHTGRRAHVIGWTRLIATWIMNGLYVMLFKKSYSKEWVEVR